MQHVEVTRVTQQARQLRKDEHVSNKKGYLNHLHLPVIVALIIEVRSVSWWRITAVIFGMKRRTAKWCVSVWFETHFIAHSTQTIFKPGVHGEQWFKAL